IGFEYPGLRGSSLGLVRRDDARRGMASQPAADLLVERRKSLASVNEEQRDVGLADRRVGLGAHPPGQRLGIFLFEAGSVDDPETKIVEAALALAPVASDPRPVVDQ